jgi:LPS export ABC transporter protein LptC
MGNNTTKLRGDSAIYLKANNLYRVMGRVEINNQVKNETLATDELFWSPDSKKIYSNKAVDIKTPDQVIHGMGMDSNQDFTEYTIRKVNGVVSVKSLPQ